MNKFLFYFIEFVLDFIIVAILPVLMVCGVPFASVGWFSIISFVTLHIRQWFVEKYKDSVAVGVDIKEGYVAIKGWTEKSKLTADEFFAHLTEIGVRTVICTDISKDGAMKGTNRELYKELSEKYSMDIVASGGVSDLDDIKALREMNLYGAIVGKAYYIGAIDLKEAIEVAK